MPLAARIARSITLFAAIVTLSPAFAQAQPRPLSFELASIKLADFPSQPFFEGFASGGGICRTNAPVISGNVVTLTKTSLCGLIRTAYRVEDYRITGAPKWMMTANRSIFFDIQAMTGMIGPASQEQVAIMLQTLLADRFHLKFHREIKELPVYAMVVAKGGTKLSTTVPEICKKPAEERFSRQGSTMSSCQPIISTARLSEALSRQADRPVVDRTGLSGEYAYVLNWTPGEAPLETNSPPYLHTAVQEQLGLKLEPQNAQIEMIAIENIERPSEN